MLYLSTVNFLLKEGKYKCILRIYNVSADAIHRICDIICRVLYHSLRSKQVRIIIGLEKYYNSNRKSLLFPHLGALIDWVRILFTTHQTT